MTCDNYIAQQLRARLKNKKTFQEAFTEFEVVVRGMGYEGVLYGCAPSIFGKDPLFVTPVFRACGLYSDELLQRYVDEDLVEHDFTVRAILAGETGNIDWFLLRYRNELTHQEVRLLEIAENFGLRNGLSLPIMNNGNGFAGISVASSKGRSAFDRLNQRCLPDLECCMHVFNEYVWTHLVVDIYRLFAEPVLGKLTPIERDYLRVLPPGKTILDISQEIGRVPGQVERIGQRVRTKFGCISSPHLIYYAGLLRFKDFL